MITTATLKLIMPNIADPAKWVDPLLQTFSRYEINAPSRQAHFIAQVAHESGSFNHLEENLNYSAERLLQVWPKRFPSLDPAQLCAHNPEALGNTVYANRMGNGPPESGDGYRYRGRGAIMLTGKANYVAAANATGFGIDFQPDLLATFPTCTAQVAGWFWKSRGCNELADHSPGNEEDFEKITRLVNGGLIGLEDRRMYLARALSTLT